MEDAPACSRIAPSPTGPLHLGNACTFLVNWALARRNGWRLVLRIEDLDRERTQAAGDADVEELLGWLGIDHDGPAVRQSARMPAYEETMERLAAQGMAYESPHSRAEVQEAARALSAPHAGDAPAPFPASLRPADPATWRFVRRDVNHRMRMEPGIERVDDEVAGTHSFDPAAEGGDCIVWTKAGHPAYQLAVTVDDMAQGVTDVVRGDDLLPSAAIQARIHRALGGTPPRWWHLPLVLDGGGARMAKRRGSRSLASLREAGATPDRIRGLVLAWIGARETPAPAGAPEFRDAVHVNILRAWHERSRRTPVVADDGSLSWLRGR